MTDLSQLWFHYNGSGLLGAAWNEIWHWGLFVGLIIVFTLAAIFSPVFKKVFAGVAAFCFLAFLIYGFGHHDEEKVCTAKVKKIYLEAHPLLTSKNTATNWKLLPSWNPAASPHYNPVTCDGPFDTNCWGQY